MSTPRAGDIGLTKIKGFTGLLVRLMQWFNGDWSKWTHVFIVLDDETVFEAQPGGARVTPLSEYDDRDVYYWCPADLTDEQRVGIVEYARVLKGTPYAYMAYLGMALYRFRVRPQWLEDYITSMDSLICSQAVDIVYERKGYVLFPDELSQDITPGDIARLAKAG